MKKKWLLALDGGTGSFRAVVFDFYGNQQAIAQREWQHLPDPRYPGSIDFNWQYNWPLIVECIQELLANGIQADEIAAISTTSMREGFVLYDDKGKELLAFSNVDARSKQEAIDLKEQFPSLEKELYQISGQSFALSAIPRLLWVKNNEPTIYQKMSTITMLNDWITYKLTGRLSVEPSNASTTGLFSLKDRSWDKKLARRVGLKETIFPPVIESGCIIGQVSQNAAKLTGLSAETPVVAGGGDAQLGSIGVGATKKGQATLFGGSFWQYEVNSATPTIDSSHRIRINCHAEKEHWQFESIAWNPGLAMRWFRDAFCQSEKKQASKEKTDVYSLLDQHIATIPAGCYGMYALFSNEMNFLELKHAAPSFINFALDAEKFNKYTFYKAIMESAGIVTYGHLLQAETLTGESPQEIIFAGGASNNSNWCQIISDITGKIIKTPIVKEATALGAAFLAGVGTGVYQDLEETKTYIKWDKCFYPNQENHDSYQEMYAHWQKIYHSQLDLSNQGLTEYMWIAPGVK
ncbi:autoinducer-2 kinase [Vagococcus sp. BWB3-3]|uniref:Autoinducer-2 kinase n=1 Tax=Vagococcus allomyrinae TaxID=2794353 RepID=A0A940SSL4_9ENTE|nr:autoinducer-2 kinase [Vagococcus allomyrinae]MBP1039390.1 autoinducer-2 kinase [Vagococcus allomyrinae]